MRNLSCKIWIATLLTFLVSSPVLSSAEVKKEYYPSGELKAETNYQNGKKEGIVKWYYENGQLQLQAYLKNGKPEGIYKTYYRNGQLSVEVNYKNGWMEGIEKRYYESGQLQYEINWKNHMRNGISKFYYRNGQLMDEENYKNDKQEGIHKGYYRNGQIKYIETYKNGQKINSKASAKKQTSAEIRAKTRDTAYENTMAGKKCEEYNNQQLDCKFKVGKDLYFIVVGIGLPDTAVTFMQSNIDGDYYASYGLMHGCVIVKHGKKNFDISLLVDFAFVSPKNAKVYKTWKECKAGY